MHQDTCENCVKSRVSGGIRQCQHNPQPYPVADSHWCAQYRPNHPFPTGVTEEMLEEALADKHAVARALLWALERLERL